MSVSEPDQEFNKNLKTIMIYVQIKDHYTKDVKALREASSPAEIFHLYPDPGIFLDMDPDQVFL
jgi:hypothetical protein